MNSLRIRAAWSQEAELDPAQRRIVRVTSITYACYYLGRLNLSIALPALAVALNVSRAEIGILGTVFFWTYGLGQFFVGEIGNTVRPRLLITLGLAITLFINLVFSFQSLLPVMAVLWGINGVGQAMGWSPIARILGDHLTPPQRGRVSATFPINSQLGAALIFAFTGIVLAVGGWPAAFLVPALLLIVVTVLWWRTGIDTHPRPAGTEAADRPRFSWRHIRQDMARLWPIMVAGACCGFVLAGTTIWIPTYVVDTGVIPSAAIGVVSAAMPLVSIGGMALAGYLMRRLGRVEVVLITVLGISALALLAAAITTQAVQAGILLCALASLGGVGAVLTSAIPLQAAGDGRTSSAAGFINGVTNLGGGLAGIGAGTILQASGWSAVLGVWSISLIVASGWVWWFWRSNTRRARRPSTDHV